MARYFQEEFTPAETTTEVSEEFKDLEFVAALVEIRLLDKPVYEIGIGGSFVSNPKAYKNIVYVGAADKNFYAQRLPRELKFKTVEMGVK